MFLSGILFNSEAWHGVSQKDINILEKVDEALLRGMLMAHAKIPLEALFLESSAIPIPFIIASRMLMYLHNILQRDDNEIVKKIFEVQKTNTSTGDFFELVCDDKLLIGLNMTDEEI